MAFRECLARVSWRFFRNFLAHFARLSVSVIYGWCMFVDAILGWFSCRISPESSPETQTMFS